jgi:23S rRNA (pseudouridine1915-N3)-methyltransferase
LRFQIISVGRESADPFAPVVSDYLKRISKWFQVDDIVLKRDRIDRTTARILKAAEGADLLVALDEKGKMYDSVQFSKEVSGWMNRGTGRVTFVIGPADGLPPRVQSAADLLLSLSKMTLPHRMARLMLAEQLYRGICIIRGVPYQK